MISEANEPAPIEYWEKIGSTTRWGRYLAEKEMGIIRRGLECAGTPSKAVDLGCGGGRWSEILAQRGWQMTCVDIDENALRSCQLKMPSATCIRVSPTDAGIPCTDRSQKLILCMEAPDVIEKSWFEVEAQRVLENGGHVIGFYMNPHSWRGLVWDSGPKNNPAGETHYTGPAYAKWKRSFLARGFEMLHEESYAWAPFPRTSNSALIPFASAMERLFLLTRLVRFAPWILFVARKKDRS